MRLALLLTAVAFAAGRAFIEPRLTNIPTFSLTYEALAHVFVGGMLGTWLMGIGVARRCQDWRIRNFGWFCFYVAVGLTAVEVVAFLWQKSSL